MKSYYWIIICVVFVATMGVASFLSNNLANKMEGMKFETGNVNLPISTPTTSTATPTTIQQNTNTSTPTTKPKTSTPKQIPSTNLYIPPVDTTSNLTPPVITNEVGEAFSHQYQQICQKTGWNTWYNCQSVDVTLPIPDGFYLHQ